MPWQIGTDLDNTLVDYHELFWRTARDLGLLSPSAPREKSAVRELLRREHGDGAWQKVQAEVYGPRLGQARLFAGALPQLEAWRAAGHSLAIVSHKTRFAAQNTAFDLHRATMAFLERHGVLARIPPEAVYVEETRQGKCRRIATLGCHVFIDDLPEVLTDQAFPDATRGVLFTSWAQAGAAVAALGGEGHGASGV